MNAEQLKQIQTPIKEQYKEKPDSAMITLKAMGKVGEGISCKIDTGKGLVQAGLHPATGGTGQLACSGDMLLEALAACAGVTLKAVATAVGVNVDNASVMVEGDLDFRGTLGVSKDAPVGFKAIRLIFNVANDVTTEQIQTLTKLTERYCVVYQTLTKGVSIETRFQS
jgi:uncharacterized OsmC-like protein